MSFVTVTVEDHVATIRLDRPPVNALNQEMNEAIREMFGALRG